MKKICVFGASGDIGSEVIRQLVETDHRILAVTRSKDTFPIQYPDIVLKEADVLNPETIQDIVFSVDIIISALGTPVYRSPVCAKGVANIVDVMNNDQKLIAISAYGANETASGLYSRFIRIVIPGHMRDKDRMEDIITKSGINYTIIRPTRLKHGKLTGNYQTGEINPGLFSRVSIPDVADLVVQSLGNHNKQIINITS